MARLIDADKLLTNVVSVSNSKGQVTWSAVSTMDILTAQTVDAVEVVRCRDCAKDGLFTCPICFIENKELCFINHSPDFYCGEGERKGGDGNG